MPKCPKCGSDIDFLITDYVSYGTNTWSVYKYSSPDGKEHLHLELVDSDAFDERQTSGYKCPECDEKLFDDDEKAAQWLKYGTAGIL